MMDLRVWKCKRYRRDYPNPSLQILLVLLWGFCSSPDYNSGKGTQKRSPFCGGGSCGRKSGRDWRQKDSQDEPEVEDLDFVYEKKKERGSGFQGFLRIWEISTKKIKTQDLVELERNGVFSIWLCVLKMWTLTPVRMGELNRDTT